MSRLRLAQRLAPLLFLTQVVVAGRADAGQSPAAASIDRPDVAIGAAAPPANAQGGSMAGMSGMNTWTFGYDGVAFATWDRQGRPRGLTQFNSQNWFMGTAAHPAAHGTLTLSLGLSLEPITVQRGGYSEIFQVGEAYKGLQVTDRQHPHDLLMQAGASWRVPAGPVNVTLTGAIVGEPALGPAAFIHRASSSENPTAPLSHHMFDSTHIAHGVLTAGLDRGPVAVEGSVFHGREPDENRYALDMGALDSWSVRGWLRPRPGIAMQVSHAYLHQPEALEPGNQRRTNGSVSWMRTSGDNFTAITGAVGRNKRNFSVVKAALVELTQKWGKTYVYTRVEGLSLETEILLFPKVVHRPHPGELVDPLQAYTIGGVRDIASPRGFEMGVGGDVQFYGVNDTLAFTHGDHPVSAHIFLRVRPPSKGGRMFDMTMGQPMANDMSGMDMK